MKSLRWWRADWKVQCGIIIRIVLNLCLYRKYLYTHEHCPNKLNHILCLVLNIDFSIWASLKIVKLVSWHAVTVMSTVLHAYYLNIPESLCRYIYYTIDWVRDLILISRWGYLTLTSYVVKYTNFLVSESSYYLPGAIGAHCAKT